MAIDFRKNPTISSPVLISEQVVQCVQSHSFSGTLLDGKLTFGSHVDTVCKKHNQHLYFFRKPQNFNVDVTRIILFYIVSLNHFLRLPS